MNDKVRNRYNDHLALLKNKGYIPVEDEENYTSMTSKIKYICPKHKDEGVQSINYYHLKEGRGCYYCGRERTIAARKTPITKELIEEAKLLCNKNNFDFIELYKNQNGLVIKFVCRKHKSLGTQEMKFHNMKREIKGCKYCASKQLPEWYVKELIAQKSPHLVIIDNFTLLNQKVKVHCNTHNYDYITAPKYLLEGHGCEYCRVEKLANCLYLSKQEVQTRVSKANPSIKIIGEYQGYKGKTEFQCSKCDYHWVGSVASMIINGTNCPNCGKNKYKGEIKLEEIFINHNINYQRQYGFEDCYDIKQLLFDFAIFDKNNQLIALCEYDGEQHYRPVNFSGNKEKAKETFNITKRHDEIKNTYCKNNNISLIRVPYYEYNNMELFVIKRLIEENISIDTTG